MDSNTTPKTIPEKSTNRKFVRPTKRRLIQLYASLLYNAHIRGFIEGEIYTGSSKAACVPGFNCYSCPGAVGACPLGALQNALASSGKHAGFYVFGMLMLFGVIFGRTICGWLCPLGLIQELLHKIPTPKIRKNKLTRALTYLKYVILAVFAVAIPLWYGIAKGIPVPGFCKYICPAGTSEGAMALLSNPKNAEYFSMLNILFTRKFVIMMLIGLACIFCYRSFCRFICPLGAIYGLFNKFAVIGVKVDTNRCNHCGACVRNCKMDVRRVGDHECIHCAKCMDVCRQNALSLKAGSYTLKAPAAGCAGDTPERTAKRKRTNTILAVIAIAGLAFALVWFNFLDPSLKKSEAAETTAAVTDSCHTEISGSETNAADSASAHAETGTSETSASETSDAAAGAETAGTDAPIGKDVGMQLEDFTVECLDGSTFHLADERGKVVIINLWATYCASCVQELPEFSDLYLEHKDDLTVLAVHNSMKLMDTNEYLADKDWAMPIADDTDDNLIWNIVGGDTTMPQTIVLDRNGIVIYNQKGAITEDVLETLYTEASGS